MAAPKPTPETETYTQYGPASAETDSVVASGDVLAYGQAASAPVERKVARKPQAIEADRLKVSLEASPEIPTLPPAAKLAVSATVTYEDTIDDRGSKEVRRYPDEFVQIQTNIPPPGKGRHDKIDPQSGPGPFTYDVGFIGEIKIAVRADVRGGKTGKRTVTLLRKTLTSVCGASLPADPTLILLTQLLFSEGGSVSAFSERELSAIAWAIRNRHDAMRSAQLAADARSWGYFAARWYHAEDPNKFFPIDTELSYAQMMTVPKQFEAYNNVDFRAALHPEKLQSIDSCRNLVRTVRIVEQVFGEPPGLADPYAGAGNPKRPGVFYWKAKVNRDGSPTTPAHHGPKLPELVDGALHYYQGLDEDYSP